MAVIRFKGLEEYELKLSRLEKMTEELAGLSLIHIYFFPF